MEYLFSILLVGQFVSPNLTSHPTITGMLNVDTSIRVDVLHKNPHHISETLTKAAQDHAWYMAETHDFEHYGKNGTPGVRAARYGYRGIVRENIAKGHESITDVFDAWRNSPEHWNSIKYDFVEVGFGYAIASDNTTYWVALYGNPISSREFMLIGNNNGLGK